MTQKQYEALIPFDKQLNLVICCYIRLNNMEFLEAINNHLGYIPNWNDRNEIKRLIENIANDYINFKNSQVNVNS